MMNPPDQPTLLVGTFNRGKVAELQAALMGRVHCLTCADFPHLTEALETGTTLQANAAIKARNYGLATGLPCLADDTGLEVDALGGLPGVDTAYFAGKPSNAEANINRLLEALAHQTERQARFRTVLAYWHPQTDSLTYFEGVLEGTIALQREGHGGFGYDPVFIPTGYTRSLAEFSTEEKNRISHRGQAIRRFGEWYSTHRLTA
jgi:XTP/dITP diphosphohydrolase